ncbi:MAG TPA: enoyl-CoA hydratase [Streptosporangiaceae bacterium]
MTEVLVDVEGKVAIVTLNRPERRNAISGSLLAALRDAVAGLDRRADVLAIVLTGADPAFCAGLDLAELGQPGGPLAGTAGGGAGGGGVLPRLTTPLIGAINGAAVTGGLELALACDFLVASDRARFADTHARVGVMPGWGLTVALPEAVGLRRAREMSATGNFIAASTALAWGLVNHVVPHEQLLGFARGLATDIASADPAAVREILTTYNEGSLGTARQAALVEVRAHRRWHAGGIDAGLVASRRDAVIERGRAQG